MAREIRANREFSSRTTDTARWAREQIKRQSGMFKYGSLDPPLQQFYSTTFTQKWSKSHEHDLVAFDNDEDDSESFGGEFAAAPEFVSAVNNDLTFFNPLKRHYLGPF